jgi:hypothetical protein
MHLGHPLIVSHKDKNKAYLFIHNKLFAKFANLKANKLTMLVVCSILNLCFPPYRFITCQPFFSLRPSLIRSLLL